MAETRPFVRFIKRAERPEPDALLGFSLPFLPDMLTSHWLSGSSPQERLEEALQLQLQLIRRFYGSGVASWDLRFVGTESLPGVAIGLLCRLSPPPQLPPGRFSDYCQERAIFIQQLFA